MDATNRRKIVGAEMNRNALDDLVGRDKFMGQLAIKRGLSIVKTGRIWQITGRGVEIRTARLAYLTDDDVNPIKLAKGLHV